MTNEQVEAAKAVATAISSAAVAIAAGAATRAKPPPIPLQRSRAPSHHHRDAGPITSSGSHREAQGASGRISHPPAMAGARSPALYLDPHIDTPARRSDRSRDLSPIPGFSSLDTQAVKWMKRRWWAISFSYLIFLAFFLALVAIEMESILRERPPVWSSRSR